MGEIASYGDFGHAEALGLNGAWLCTGVREGCDHCEFKMEQFKRKTIV